MKLLLDTHVFLWWRQNSTTLGRKAREPIASADMVFVSAVSAWEAAIKVASGKLRLEGSFEAWVEESGFLKLARPVPPRRGRGSASRHHHDPFDRMLIAQAQVEGLVVVTADRRFEPYGVPIIWA